MTILKRLVVGLLPAAIFGLYAQWPALAFLCIFMILPWAILYTDDRAPRVAWIYYFLGAYATWLTANAEAWRFGWYAAVGMGLGFVGPWLPFAPALSFVHRKWRLPRSVSVPVLWVATEWVRATFSISHFDLYALGYTLARFPIVIQIADIVGVYGLSFLVAAVSGMLADAYFAVRDRDRERVGAWGALARPAVVRAAVALFAASVVVVVYGVYRLGTIEHREGPTLAIVQPNTPHTQTNMVGVHLSQLVLTERGVPAGEVDLIVWPENAILDNIRREGTYLDDLSWMAREKRAWFLVGALGKAQGKPGKTTNGAYLIEPTGDIVDHYDKRMLFPWGEYVPGDTLTAKWWPWFHGLHRKLTRMGWGFLPTGDPGQGNTIFRFPWDGETVSFATLICNENTYPPFPAESGRTGATFFVNITSEGSVGGPVQEQLLRIAILRAVENRMSYVRAGNTGISGTIDATGLVRELLRGPGGATIDTRGVLVTRVPIHEGATTVYAATGDGFVKLVVAAAVILLLLAPWAGRRRSRGTLAVACVAVAMMTSGCAIDPGLGDDPSRVDDAIERARDAFSAGDCGEAIASVKVACASYEGCRVGIDTLGTCYERGVAHEEAIAVFGAIADKHPDLAPRALVYKGMFEDLSLDLEAARRSYEASLELEPSTVAFGKLGNLLMRMDDRDRAIETFEDGLAFDPDSIQLRYILGRAKRVVGDLDEAERVLEEVLEREPTHASAWVNLGRVRWHRGDTEGALQAFRTGLRSEPGNIEARFMLARHALRTGDLERVDALIREIRQIEAGFGRGPRRYD